MYIKLNLPYDVINSNKHFTDLPESETVMSDIETILPEIETALPQIETALP